MRLVLLLSLFVVLAHAKLAVVVSYPYIKSITEAIAGDKVTVETLAQAKWDPHFVSPKPSLVTKMRNADLLIINGADLEIGWLPPLLEHANNAQINQPNNQLDLSKKVTLIEVPTNISRAGGDVHADGNPHFHLDPRNIPFLAEAITTFLSQKDPLNGQEYRKNLSQFKQQWGTHVKRWDTLMAPLRGKEVVQYHPVFNYFIKAYGLKTIGTIEPLAGIPPSSAHTMKLIALMKEKNPYCIMHDVYHPTKTGEFIADKTGVKLVLLPHDVGAMSNTSNLVNFFDSLTQALK
jgi:zinc/manganese transport system substrate-binding protein